MLKIFYEWTLYMAKQPYAMPALALISFAASSLFPIPVEAMILPMVLANRDQAWKIALVATFASLAGGVFGYAVGALFFDSLGVHILKLLGYRETFESVQQGMQEWDVWFIALGAFTPVPYKLITITSGFLKINLLTFMIVSLLARGARYFLVAFLLWHFGPTIRRFLDRHLGFATIGFFLVVFLGFLALKLVP